VTQPTIHASVSGGRISVVSQGTSIQATPSSGPTINASVQTASVAASIQNSGVVAKVDPAAVIAASVAGSGGSSGITSLSQAADVALNNVSDGDVLRFSQTRWRNYSELQLTDGGNF
jgi:hypothetical protein